MKHSYSFLGLGFLSLLFSCSPSYFTIDVEMKSPSKSGIDFNDKSIAILYANNGNELDSTFNASVSDGFAAAMEKEYFGGENIIDLYSVSGKGDYKQKDSLVNFLIETNSDIIVYFAEPEIELEQAVNKIPYSTSVHIYDAFDAEDKVHSYSFSSKLPMRDGTKESIALAAKVDGDAAAASFKPQWHNNSFYFLYYEVGKASKWQAAAYAVADYRWKDAIEIWLTLLDTNDLLRKSCAEYNIAAACCILGQKDLAREWLDKSDADQKLSVSAELRKLLK